MKKSELMKKGFSAKDAEIISKYSEEHSAIPAIQLAAAGVKRLFRTMTWVVIAAVVIYLIKTL